jgi:glycosyltransferase involved in cell wall biosynthesis
MPTVSIVMPTFNRVEFIRATVASVRAQTFPDWNLIIADDGSDDETRAYLRSLTGDSRLQLLWQEHSGSPGVARNAALRHSKSEYIAFLDSDDLWTASKLGIQLASLGSKPQCAWSYTSFSFINELGEPILEDISRRWPTPSGWIAPQLIDMSIAIAPSCVLMRRSVIEEYGGFDERLTMCNDYDLWLRSAMRYQVDGIGEALVQKRRHHQHYGDDVGAFEERRQALDKLVRSGISPRHKSRVRRQYAKIAIGISKSHARSGRTLLALRSIALADPQHWRYLEWWHDAAGVLARILAPPIVRRIVRNYRAGARQHSSM